jgi:glutamate/tyrosine decarboxylase-like PLP-dependent enzyme
MSIWTQIGREVEDFTGSIRELPVSTVASPEAVRRDVESRFDFKAAVPLDALVREVASLLRKYAVHVTHPRYFGLFNPSVHEAGIAADTLAALYNPQLAAWSHSPAASELESLALKHLARALGFDANSIFANFTTGGLESNLSAVLVALVHCFPEYERRGWAGLDAPLSIYVTSESHHSFVKICRMTGLGIDALREVPTTAAFAMDVGALRDRIGADANTGRRPFLIVATAGTTGGGLIDPLSELAEVAADTGIWLHVDAAWGGAAALVRRLRHLLVGIERADSVTWDAHKWLSVPMGAGMFFCRHGDAVRRAFNVSTSYMPSQVDDAPVDPYFTTMQWSRRAIGLKVFMSLAACGAEGFAELIDRQARMGDLLRVKLGEAGWIVVNETALPLVCATHDDIRQGRCSAVDIVRATVARGKVWISDVVLGGRERVIRACITSFRTVEDDLDVLVTELEASRRASRQLAE